MWYRLCGMVIGFAGVALIASNYGFCSSSGMSWLLLGSIAFALHSVLSRQVGEQGTAILVWMSLLNVPLLLGVLFMLNDNIAEQISTATHKYWLAIAFMSIFVNGIAHGSWVKVVQKYSIDVVMPFYCLIPLFACMFGHLLLGEVYSYNVFFGGALILLGLMISQTKFRNILQNKVQTIE